MAGFRIQKRQNHPSTKAKLAKREAASYCSFLHFIYFAVNRNKFIYKQKR